MSREMTKLNLEVTIPTQYVNKFLQMLDCMRWCGKVGASRSIAFMADGDGNFHPFNFKIDGKEIESDINWLEFDEDYDPELNKQLPQPFKTKLKPDFYFDAT